VRLQFSSSRPGFFCSVFPARFSSTALSFLLLGLDLSMARPGLVALAYLGHEARAASAGTKGVKFCA
jgi:hypothetical protein